MMTNIQVDYLDRKIGHAGDQLMWINGEPVAAISGEVIPVQDPATGQTIGSAPAGGRADADRAVAAARRSFDQGIWRNLGGGARQLILWRAAGLLEAHADELADLEALNSGMLLPMARMMVHGAIEMLRYYAGAATRIHGQTSEMSAPETGQFQAYTAREPVGVAALVVAWNLPIALTVCKLSSALAAGCSCIVKPAEETPFTALLLTRLFEEAGVPAGVINVLTGHGHEAGAALAEHPDVDKIAFTGSTEIGKVIVNAATGNLKKVTLELGGKSPVLVFNDANLARAVPTIAAGIFSHAGQLCMAGSRLYVQRGVYDEVVNGIAKIANGLKTGHAFDAAAQLGPLISGRQMQRVLGLISSGRQEGAELVAGGTQTGERGYFVRPTILANPTPNARILREEIFGPVLTVMAFDEMEEAIAAGNRTDYGLAAAVWSEDVHKSHLAAKHLQAGTVWINCGFVSDVSMPTGGFKQSGWGRELGAEGLDAYLQTKSVFSALSA